ncbi:hypothetical protein G7043_36885 [Lentzea sp. NEAU-D13]|uniref:PPE-repeat protein n=1 Tax=Lentzea alba TaxID=2714351 RepID=A0A7C9RZV3_9PSEU|nr:hypothetical protein [Lentzea alba]NGY64502.1 hypothetical protein [Lentzea alba]
MTGPNELVVKPDAEPGGLVNAGTGDNGWMTGISIAESAMDTFNGVKDGNWVEAGLGMVGLAADAAAMAIDPFGTLMSSAASFLMEHVQPLKDMLDWLAGDPPVIESYSATWGKVSEELGKIAEEYGALVASGAKGWTGAAAEKYLENSKVHGDALTGAASAAGTVGTVVGMMGMVVAFVREMVRDLIADLVGKLIAWVLEAAFSLGFGTPVIVAQAVAAISRWAAKIAKIVQDLLNTIKKVSPLLKRLVEVFEKIMKAVGKLARKVTGLDALSSGNVRPGGFVQTGRPDIDAPSGAAGRGDDGSATPSSATPDPNAPSPNAPGSSSPGPNTPSASSPGASSPGPNTPGSATPGPNTSSSSAPGPNTPSPDSPSSNLPRDTTSTSSTGTPTADPATRPGRSEPADTPTTAPRPGRHPSSTDVDDVPRGTAPASGPSTTPRDATPSGGHRSGPAGQPITTAGGGGGPTTSGGSHGGGADGGGNSGGSPTAPTPSRTDSTSAATTAAPEAPSRPGQPHPNAPNSTPPGTPAQHPTHGGAPSGGGAPAGTGSGGGAPAGGGARPGGGGWTGTPGSRGDLGSSTPSARTPDNARPSSVSPSAASTPHPAAPHAGPPAHGPGYTSPTSPAAHGGPGSAPGGQPPRAVDPTHARPGSTDPSSYTPPHTNAGQPPQRGPQSVPPHANQSHASPPPQRGPQHTGPSRAGSGSSRPDLPAPGTRPGGTPPGPRPDGPRPAGPPGTRPAGPTPGNARPDGPAPGPRPDGARPRAADAPARNPVPPHQHDVPGTRPHDTSPPHHDPPRRAPDDVPAPRREPDGTPGPRRDPEQGTPPRRDPDGTDPGTPHKDPDGTPHRDADRPDIDEAHARHGESTPAGISHHRGDPDMGDLPHRVPHDPRYFTADVHVTPDGRARIGNHTYTPEEYGDLLRRNGWDGRTPIRLIGCDAGSNDFANRLSRHTGADVLAPTKPAWTDASGRVYTSDAEIGPDGNRQPKIPPNGEWQTHRPDGTTTKAGDDGFVPGTKDTDKTDLDPAGARDRGKPDDSWQKKPDQPSGKTPREKIDDQSYFDKHYIKYKDNDGKVIIARRPGAREDSDGKETHHLRWRNGRLEFAKDAPPPLRPDFDKSRHERFDENERRVLPKEPEDARTPDHSDTSANTTGTPQDTATAPERPSTSGWREEHRERIRVAMEERNAAAAHHEKTSKSFDGGSQEMKDAMSRRRDAGEVLGEEAGELAFRNRLAREYGGDVDFVRRADPDNPGREVFDVVDPNNPGEPLATVRPLHNTGAGSGEFDQIFEIHERGADNPRYVIQEAKGPKGEYSARTLPDGTSVNQLRRDYMEDVLDAMANDKDPNKRALAAQIEIALNDRRVDYVEVRARVDQETGARTATYAGFDYKPVNLYPTTGTES